MTGAMAGGMAHAMAISMDGAMARAMAMSGARELDGAMAQARDGARVRIGAMNMTGTMGSSERSPKITPATAMDRDGATAGVVMMDRLVK